MILVDSSVLIGLLRGHARPAIDRLRNLESDGVPYAIPALCVQEVLQGARDESEWSRLHAVLTTQRIVSPDDPTEGAVGAARLYFECRRRGITPRSTIDCAIAHLAMSRDALLLHDDDDFDRMATVCDLRVARS